MIVVIVGVTGVGKTTVGAQLAERLGWRFADDDEFHSSSNVAKLRAGVPLSDADRWPWIDRIIEVLAEARDTGTDLVLACSALKRAYRERLRAGHDDVRFAFLDASAPEVAARLQRRVGHFASPTLLESQVADFEPPASGESHVWIDAAKHPTHIVDEIIARLSLDG